MQLNQEIEGVPQGNPSQNQQEDLPLQITQPKYKSFKKIFLLISTISLSSFYFGYTIIYLSTIDFESVMEIFNIQMDKAQAEGLLTFCVQLGGLFGSAMSSYFIGNVARRKSILMINYTAVILGLLSFFADLKFYMLLRVGQGICAGLYSAMVPLLIKQTAPFELLGVFGVFQQLFITIGIFLACFFSFILAKIFNDPTGIQYWPYVFALPLVVIAIQTLLLHLVFYFEPPKYLINQRQDSEARRVIIQLYKIEYVDEVIRAYENDCQAEEQSTNLDSKEKQAWLPKAVALHLSLLQQFVGISAVAIYAGQIASGALSSLKHILPSIINFEQVITAVASSYLLTKYGRKTILQYGTIGCILTTVTIGIGFAINSYASSFSVFLILTGLFCYMANFGLTLGPIVWMYIPEIVNASFLPYSTMMNWGGAAMCILFFPIIKAILPGQNPAGLFFFFAIWSACSFFVNKKYVIETKGLTESQIKRKYDGMQSKNS